jgi:thiol-disulfide isomerase/thioredoxin
MSIRGFSSWGLVALLAMTLGCQDNEVPSAVSDGNKSPEISGTDVNGKPVSISQFSGKVVLLDFWATYCGPCLAAIPHEVELQKKYSGRPFAILGVSVDQEKDDLRQFLNQQPLPWPNIYDENGVIAKQWGVRGIPTFVLIDHQGKIAKRWVGAQLDEIDSAVEKAVNDAEKR